ncbi:MAG TPA: prepilin-type N-terminal cleavage/methylation domain-containing protein [Syntrophomonadaceae bacterium]|nr:prepilin-type N-terminal cleavage/methylation domain-containing protein [Syntrophomonadaceae bacterium]
MLMKMRSKMQNQKGFTLVELMVVVVILGILVAIAIPVYNNVTAKANQRAVESNLRIIDGAVMQYKAAEGITDTEVNVDADANPAGGVLATYLKEWPAGPDGVVYSVVDDDATVTSEEDLDWFGTANTSFTLDTIAWPEKTEPETP